jgi:acyl-CoA thioesterase
MTDQEADPIHYAREIVGRDPMATFLGITVDEVRKGYARCSLVIKPEYLNAVERAHGSAIYAVADQAFAVAGNSLGHKGIALNFTINFATGAAKGERIVAEATSLHIGRKVSLWRVLVTGSEGRLVASCEGVAYHKD